MGSDRLTVREIARLAGVSVATVSRVSNGVGQVSEETRRRVQRAIEEHGYRPDHLGRALAAGRHGAVGLVFPGLSGPYFSELIQGFEAEAVHTRTSVHILCTHLRDDSDAQVVEMARRVDGLAVFGGTVSPDTLRELAALVPVVVLAGEGPPGVPSVRAENVAAATALTRHLLADHGLRGLVFVGDPRNSPDVTGRWEGFRDAHRQLGLPLPRAPLRVGLEQHDGVFAADQLLSRAAPPRGVVCANDETALGMLVGAAARGVRVPADLVVTGFDDIPMAALVSPALTTVRQPVRELAGRTARLLLRAAAGETGGSDAALVLPTDLVVRRSCGCPATTGAGPATAPSPATKAGFTTEADRTGHRPAAHGPTDKHTTTEHDPTAAGRRPAAGDRTVR
ncbi:MULTISPECIES: LacI family DNA-binding transcriptional regulator [unclassified Micromonospora]|uniref:LacI family DNA-binding transcriptional regulator n=1 Tax=unclassified Micromonospora TaxID=2617518 RepID=UPI00098D1363|nr:MULTISPECIES: LacI family DNA-binding transcriptional regulator [unclassified Micromonospora]MDI5938806.1 LacI family DNA-binding transcriptional regulator [Micromonospora sp. DH15]OON30584.1 LacI family transcriptional regulator [Micromonospora sp. Rc5]